MRKGRAILLFGALVALYPLSYWIASRKGAYDARGPWGGSAGPNGTPVFAPKWGYDWYAFPDASSAFEKGAERFYFPMQALDRWLWHRNYRDRHSEPKYPTRNYVDPRTGVRRDVP